MMLGIEEILCELGGTDGGGCGRESENNGGLPPGFRFHPTDEELITFYLASKVFSSSTFCGVDIAEVDLNRCEPWELPGTFFTLNHTHIYLDNCIHVHDFILETFSFFTF